MASGYKYAEVYDIQIFISIFPRIYQGESRPRDTKFFPKLRKPETKKKSIIPRSQIIIRLKFGLAEFISCCVDCDRCDKSVRFIIID